MYSEHKVNEELYEQETNDYYGFNGLYNTDV